jgi:hypothetical protein
MKTLISFRLTYETEETHCQWDDEFESGVLPVNCEHRICEDYICPWQRISILSWLGLWYIQMVLDTICEMRLYGTVKIGVRPRKGRGQCRCLVSASMGRYGNIRVAGHDSSCAKTNINSSAGVPGRICIHGGLHALLRKTVVYLESSTWPFRGGYLGQFVFGTQCQSDPSGRNMESEAQGVLSLVDRARSNQIGCSRRKPCGSRCT